MNTMNTEQTLPTLKCAGVIIYRIVSGIPEFLLVETYQKKYAMSFPKGRREKDETVVQTAVRETTEETGLLPTDYHLDTNHFHIETLGYDRQPHIIYFSGRVHDPDVKLEPIDIKEIKNIGWFTAEEASNMHTEFSFQRRQIVRKAKQKILLGCLNPDSSIINCKKNYI
jgi:8-oxo-dGTP pyrophosphatase MutT (NUDIX family)